MTKEELKALEDTIFASFIRCNVMDIHNAREHASLAVHHMKNAMAAKAIRTDREQYCFTACQ